MRKVSDLQESGVLHVEDGNHGEYRPRRHEFSHRGSAFIRATDMRDGLVDFAGADKINEVALDRVRKGIGAAGDILFSHKGTVGKLAVAPEGSPLFVCSPQTTFWRVLDKERLDPRFLYCFMRSKQFRDQWFVRKGETDMADYVSLTAQRQLYVAVPAIEEQRAISSVIGALDDKIQLNREMNRTLEAMAQALFKSWFVDFDPVVAKAAGQAPIGMDAETAALFPDRFVESELGPIPEGWPVCSLTELVDVNPRRTLAKGTPSPYLAMRDMPTNSALPEHWSLREAGSGMRFQNGDTLVARITPCLENGKTSYVNFLKPNEIGWGSTEYIVLRSKAPYPPEFSYFLARSDDFRGFCIANMTGSSGRQRVPANSLTRFKLASPGGDVAKAFDAWAKPALKAMRSHIEEATTIAQLRDIQLPRLLAGEIRVAEAEQTIAEVV